MDAWVIDNTRIITIKSFSNYIEVTRQTVYSWIYRGMPVVESSEGGKFLILLDEAIEWIKIRGFIK